MSLSVKAICKSCPNIQIVDLSGSNVTNDNVKELTRSCVKISEVSLLNSNKITDEIFLDFTVNLKYLRVLKLGGNEREN